MEDQEFINQLAEKLSKLGTVRPLGFHYLHPYGTVPADSIICNGATYSRALYKDFFDYITTQGWVKTEAEWQEISERDNGFCPFYSSGDGSTNFRTPKFAPYQQIAMGVAQATTYHQAGVPNITGEHDGNPWVSEASGCFEYLSSKKIVPNGQENATYGVRFDASRSSSVYGASDTVQPETHSWVMCVVAYGIATNVGSVDVSNVMSAVAQVQADVGAIPSPKVYVTETWRSGAQWYRVWGDGFIEQGGKLTFTGKASIVREITFNKPFASSMIGLSLMAGRNSGTHSDSEYGYGVYAYSTTKVSVSAWNETGSATTLWWYANGY